MSAGMPLVSPRRLGRALAIAVFGTGLALSASRVVGEVVEPVFFVPVALAVLTGWLITPLPAMWRAGGQLVAFAVAVVVVAFVAGGNTADALHGLLDGPRQVLTTRWPSPQWPTIYVALAAVIHLALAAAMELAMRRRWRVLAALPCIVALIALVAVGAPDGPQLAAIATATTATFLLLWIGLDDRVPNIRWASPIAVAVAVTASLVTAGIVWSARADPREDESARGQLSLLDPLADVVAQRNAQPPRSLYEVSSPSLPRLTHWRAAVLDQYDGESWSATGELAPSGTRIATPTGAAQITVEQRVLTAETPMWALPGTVLRSTESVETDREQRVVRIVGDVPADSTFVVEPLTAFDAAAGGILSRVIPTEIETSFVTFARERAGNGTLLQQVAALAADMQVEYDFDPDAPGGMQLKSLEYFLKDARVGNQEQFVAAFVLLTRSLGIEARIATGYVVDAPTTTSITLTTADAGTWPEVRVDGRWAVVAVVPPAAAAGEQPDAGQATARTPQAVQPALPVEADTDAVSNPIDDTLAPASHDSWATVRLWASRVAVVLAAMCGAFLLYAFVVRARKWWRRRGLRSSDPTHRVGTAWLLATDALVDAGATLHASQTNAELVAAGVEVQPSVGAPLRQLRRHADIASYTTAAIAPDGAADAVEQLRLIEAGIVHSSTLRWRWKWRLSTRSLRRRTGSPLRSSRF